jgi:hypothetical protein
MIKPLKGRGGREERNQEQEQRRGERSEVRQGVGGYKRKKDTEEEEGRPGTTAMRASMYMVGVPG